MSSAAPSPAVDTAAPSGGPGPVVAANAARFDADVAAHLAVVPGAPCRPGVTRDQGVYVFSPLYFFFLSLRHSVDHYL